MLYAIIPLAIINFGIVVYISSFYKKFNETVKDPYYIMTVILNFVGGFLMLLAACYYSNIYTKTGFPLLKNIIISFLAFDSIYYWIHYTTHNNTSIYNITHKNHHTQIGLMPLDAYHNDIFEVIIVSLLTCMLPLLFIESMFEYFFIIAILYLHSTYLHSEIKSNFIIPFFNDTVFHNLHHKIGKGNYSIFFTFWDDYMKTRLNTTYIKEETALATMTMDEFKEECKKGKKLTIISNSIVNCETWINDHPGGKSAIEELIGKDSTESFMKIHGNSNFANEMLKTLTIAKLNAI